MHILKKPYGAAILCGLAACFCGFGLVQLNDQHYLEAILLFFNSATLVLCAHNIGLRIETEAQLNHVNNQLSQVLRLEAMQGIEEANAQATERLRRAHDRVMQWRYERTGIEDGWLVPDNTWPTHYVVPENVDTTEKQKEKEEPALPEAKKMPNILKLLSGRKQNV